MKTIEELLNAFQPLEANCTAKQLETCLDSFNIVDILTNYAPADRQSTEIKGVDTGVTLNLEDFNLFRILHGLLTGIVQKDENKTLELNAKIRRKLKRLVEIIAEVIAKNPQNTTRATTAKKEENKKGKIERQNPESSAKAAASEDKEEVDNDPLTADKALVALIERVASSTTATDLETNLASVKPGIGNTHSRRKLKRLIEQLTSKSEIESSMNAKIRRRVTRVLKILSPGDDSASGDPNQSSSKIVAGDDDGETKSRKRKAAEISAPIKVPHIVFVGQLPYTCSVDDLRTFFQQNKITGEMKVRLLTDARTKESKGMAFVEFSTLEDLNTALLLHHAVFMNRKINIEKSCGGKDAKKRKEIIEQHKVKQQKTIEFTFQQLFDDYAEKKVLNPQTLGKEFKSKLTSYSPLILSKALERYAALPPNDRKLAKLDELFNHQIPSLKTSIDS